MLHLGSEFNSRVWGRKEFKQGQAGYFQYNLFLTWSPACRSEIHLSGVIASLVVGHK